MLAPHAGGRPSRKKRGAGHCASAPPPVATAAMTSWQQLLRPRGGTWALGAGGLRYKRVRRATAARRRQRSSDPGAAARRGLAVTPPRFRRNQRSPGNPLHPLCDAERPWSPVFKRGRLPALARRLCSLPHA